MARQVDPEFGDYEKDDGYLPDPSDLNEEIDSQADRVAEESLYHFDDTGKLGGEQIEPIQAEADDPAEILSVNYSRSTNGNGLNESRTERPPLQRPARSSRAALRYRELTESSSETTQALQDRHALMKALAEAAQKSRNTQDVIHLAAAIVPLAAQAAGAQTTFLVPILPVLLRGAASAARVMHNEPASRLYLRLMPMILEKTFQRLAQNAESGETVTAEEAADVLAEITGSAIAEYYQMRRLGK